MSFTSIVTCCLMQAALPAAGTKVDVTVKTMPPTTRTYYLHLPPASAKPSSGKWPVVFVFHGLASDPAEMQYVSDFNKKADDAGFIAVYPLGTGQAVLGWNAGNCCGSKADDIAFFNLMLDDLLNTQSADKSRVFLTGMSNGAMLCHHLASDIATSKKLTAIATVAGTIAHAPPLLPAGQRPLPILHIHGSKDPIVAYDSMASSSSPSSYVDDTIDAWRVANKCVSPATTKTLPADPRDKGATTVELSESTNAAGKTVVVRYRIVGGGHIWPGNQKSYQEAKKIGDTSLGTVSMNISATDVIWDFFSKN